MAYQHFSPHSDAPRPCWYCRHYAGPCWGDPTLADCRRVPERPSCKAMAAEGCAYYEREPGVDDDGWRPAPRVWAIGTPGLPRG